MSINEFNVCITLNTRFCNSELKMRLGRHFVLALMSDMFLNDIRVRAIERMRPCKPVTVS